MEALKRIGMCGVVPVVVINDVKKAVPVARALLDGGVDIMEITFRTGAAAEAIQNVAAKCPDMLVGAGTVLSVEQARTAEASGARFIVCPGLDDEVTDWCIERSIPVVPGCVTPSEITRALKRGLNIIKFFPADTFGGISAMKALSAPFTGVRFIPTGGVNAANLKEYMSKPFIFAAGGSWLCAKNDIDLENYDNITALCSQARTVVKGVR